MYPDSQLWFKVVCPVRWLEETSKETHLYAFFLGF
jgi:hypothetical protein